MSYSPIIPSSGHNGWAFLKRTMDRQKAAFNADPQIKRDEAYFREKIGTIKTADQLVSDYRLLRVSLGAFGLSNDMKSKPFIRRILSEGTTDKNDIANRLSNKQYTELSKTFGFGDHKIPLTQDKDFSDKIIAQYRRQMFEEAVGKVDDNMRIALYAERQLPELAQKGSTDDAKWFTVMGSPPLRKLFETAFGLPKSFAAIDIDRQLRIFKEKAQNFFKDSSIKQFDQKENQEKLLRLFFARADAAPNGASAGSSAILSLLQGAPRS